MLELLVLIGRALALACRGHDELVLENVALRQQLRAMKRTTKRPHLRTRDRLFWIVLSRIWRHWRTAVVLVRADTVVRWHRDWLRRRWIRRSRPQPVGRPLIHHHIRTVVHEMATANPLWGAPRIHGELRTLGVDVSEGTVSRLWNGVRVRVANVADVPHQSSRLGRFDGFLHRSYAHRPVLFVLVILSHQRRRIVHVNITAHPTAIWTAQQVVDAFPDDTAPRWLHQDRDGIYGDAFQRRLAGMGIAEVVSAPASPWQNPFVERLIGSIRRECLNHVIIISEAHLRGVLTSYVQYYHRTRTHLGLQKDTPDHRPASGKPNGPIVVIPEVGGLHHRYERRAV